VSPKKPRTPRPKNAAVEASPPTGGVAESFALAGTERRHPALGLGLWALGHWRAEDEAHTRDAIARAFELGVRWFDTAEVYGAGRSERLLGEYLHRTPTAGTDAFVVTKVSWEHLRPIQIRAALINSLERLGRRSVDLYLVHAPDARVPIAETMTTLESLWKDGKIGAIGVSNFSVEELEEARRHLRETSIAVNQIRYSLLDRDDADAVVDYCRANGILVEAYSPLARGILAGRYLGGGKVPPEVRRFAQDLYGESTLADVLERGRRLGELAAEAHVPLASIALRWLASKGIAAVFGSSRPAHVEEVVRAWALRPDDRILARAEEIARGARA
jgi:myo-inositol catabolism protein IolS